MKHVHAVQTLLMSNINFNKHVHFVWPCNCNTIILRPHTCHSCDTNPELGSFKVLLLVLLLVLLFCSSFIRRRNNRERKTLNEAK